MSAQELANWIDKNPSTFGKTKKYTKKVASSYFVGKKELYLL